MSHKPSRPALEDTAYHEAGHAVAAWVENRQHGIQRVSIKPEGKELGRVVSLRQASKRKVTRLWQVRRLLEPEVVGLWAGLIAAQRHSGDDHDSLDGFGPDFQQITELTPLCVGSERERAAYAVWLKDRAEALVDYYWPQIESVANALLEHEELDGQAIRNLLSPRKSS